MPVGIDTTDEEWKCASVFFEQNPFEKLYQAQTQESHTFFKLENGKILCQGKSLNSGDYGEVFPLYEQGTDIPLMVAKVPIKHDAENEGRPEKELEIAKKLGMYCESVQSKKAPIKTIILLSYFPGYQAECLRTGRRHINTIRTDLKTAYNVSDDSLKAFNEIAADLYTRGITSAQFNDIVDCYCNNKATTVEMSLHLSRFENLVSNKKEVLFKLNNGTMLDSLQQKKRILILCNLTSYNDNDRLIAIYSAIGKLLSLHSIEYAHNDIKEANILVNPDTMETTLIDFGECEKSDKNSIKKDIEDLSDVALNVLTSQKPETMQAFKIKFTSDAKKFIQSLRQPGQSSAIAGALTALGQQLEQQQASVPTATHVHSADGWCNASFKQHEGDKFSLQSMVEPAQAVPATSQSTVEPAPAVPATSSGRKSPLTPF